MIVQTQLTQATLKIRLPGRIFFLINSKPDSSSLEVSMNEMQHLTDVARQCVGRSKFQLRADPLWAPDIVDCSSFVQWLFAQVGIDLSRLAHQQFEFCGKYLCPQEAKPGDLIFRQGFWPRFQVCPVLGVGHVGFVTSDKTIIHARYKKSVVEDDSPETFFNFKQSGVCVGRL